MNIAEATEVLRRVELGSPFVVSANGEVDWAPDVHAPEVYHVDGEGQDVDINSTSWAPFSTGYTGQYGYNGPVMHASECLGGRLAYDIMTTPGVYVVTTVEVLDCDDSCESECLGEHGPAGWIALGRVGS